MLPDIDSDSSRSFQECIYLTAGIAAVLVVSKLKEFPLNPEIITLAGAGMFFFIRFGVGSMLKRWTVHRGMFHSIPAAAIAAELVFLFSSGPVEWRLYKGFAIFLGFLSHLLLDEIFSIDLAGRRIKKSFGTAIKMYDPKHLGNSLCFYAATAVLFIVATKEPGIAEAIDEQGDRLVAEAATHVEAGKEKPWWSSLLAVEDALEKRFSVARERMGIENVRRSQDGVPVDCARYRSDFQTVSGHVSQVLSENFSGIPLPFSPNTMTPNTVSQASSPLPSPTDDPVDDPVAVSPGVLPQSALAGTSVVYRTPSQFPEADSLESLFSESNQAGRTDNSTGFGRNGSSAERSRNPLRWEPEEHTVSIPDDPVFSRALVHPGVHSQVLPLDSVSSLEIQAVLPSVPQAVPSTSILQMRPDSMADSATDSAADSTAGLRENEAHIAKAMVSILPMREEENGGNGGRNIMGTGLGAIPFDAGLFDAGPSNPPGVRGSRENTPQPPRMPATIFLP